jgi:hypothetical protein
LIGYIPLPFGNGRFVVRGAQLTDQRGRLLVKIRRFFVGVSQAGLVAGFDQVQQRFGLIIRQSVMVRQ